jgi:Ca2+-binding RTX toxin-like protein
MATIKGTSGNDNFIDASQGNPGADAFYGYAGTDSITYAGASSLFGFGLNDLGLFTATSSARGTDSLSSIETLTFSDGSISIGNGGFRVNTTTTGNQLSPAAARLADGGCVITWETTSGLAFQRYDASGTATGAEGSLTGTSVYGPVVAGLTAGGFAMAWQGYDSLTGDYDIYVQRYTNVGAANGTTVKVNATTAGWQDSPAIAALTGGDFVVTWSSVGASGYDIYARRISGTTGLAIDASDVRINTTTSGDQFAPAVTALADGGYLVAWTAGGNQDGNGLGIYCQRYSSAGAASGSETLVNVSTSGDQQDASVTTLANGNVVVTWESAASGGGSAVYARLYTWNGSTLTGGSEVRVNTTSATYQDQPSVTALAGGGYVITWKSWNVTGTTCDVMSQRFDSAGSAVGGETNVSRSPISTPSDPTVVGLGDGSYLAAWDGHDGSQTDIVAQRFDGSGNRVGAYLTGDGNANTITWTDTESIVIDGGAGNDTITGSTGKDTLIGGIGNDVFVVQNTLDVIVENVGGGTDAVQSSVTYALSSNIESLTLTGSANINGTGNSDNNTITGNTGDNRLDGGSGADTLIGGDGNDTYVVDNAGDTITESGTGTDTVETSVSYSIASIASIENLTVTGTASVAVSGNGGNNVITANSGADTLNGGDGADTFVLGTYLTSADAIVGGNGTDALTFTDNGTATSDLDGVSAVEIVTLGDAATSVVTVDGLVASGQTLTVTAAALSGTNALTWNGGSELDGKFNITGSLQSDVIAGGAGNDTLAGSDGNDTLSAGAGNDSLDGGNGNDVFNFGINLSSSDTVSGGAGIDILNFTDSGVGTGELGHVSGVETVVLGDAAASITVADGLVAAGQTLTVTAAALTGTNALVWDGAAETDGTFTLTGSNQADTLIGGGGDDSIFGAVGNDSIVGGGGNDTINGAKGWDTILGGEGNDILTGATGDDSLDGGNGIDTASYSISTDGVTVNLTTGVGGSTIPTPGVGSGTDTLVNIENVIGSAYNDSLTGDGGANVLTAGTGNDTLAGAGGSDTFVFDLNLTVADVVDGGLGNDELDYTDVGGGATNELNGVTGVETIVLGNAATSVTTLDTLVAAGQVLTVNANALTGANALTLNGVAELDGSFNISATAQSDTISCGAGNDTIVAFAGADVLIGGAGNDLFVFGGNLDANDIVAGGDGTDVLTYTDDGTATTDLVGVTSMESITLGDAATSVVTTDGLVSAGQTLVVTAAALTGVNGLTWIGSAETDGSFNITGSNQADSITGGTGNDTVTGGDGNDTLTAGAGIDSLAGGNGSDIFNFAGNLTGTDTVAGGADADTLNYTDNGLSTDELDHVTGIETLVLGNAATSVVTVDGLVAAGQTLTVTAAALVGANALNWNGAAESDGTFTLTGSSQADTLIGGGGADSLFGAVGNDLIVGGDGNDTINGAKGWDTILGGEGNDLLTGAMGDDSIDGGNGNDTVSYSISSDGVTVNLATGVGGSTTPAPGVGSGTDALANIESVIGSTFNDILIGDGAANALTGGAGNDTITGGGGNDIFIFNAALNGSTNVDTLADFATGDVIELDHAVFLALSAGALAASAFNSGAGMTSGADASDRIVYDETTGDLYYDADGSGGTAAVKIATLGGTPTISETDFNII